MDIKEINIVYQGLFTEIDRVNFVFTGGNEANISSPISGMKESRENE